MIEVTIYDLATGRILKQGIFPDLENVQANIGTGEGSVEGLFDSTTHFIQDGVAVEFPEKPSPCCVWDGTQWVDPRTESDWTTELYARRAEASMPRSDFIIRCVNFGVFDQQEGFQAASGTITPTMQTIIDGLPLEEQFGASVIWTASSTVTRNNTLIISMAAAIFIDEWTLDEVFGVEWPDPLPSWPEGKLHP